MWIGDLDKVYLANQSVHYINYTNTSHIMILFIVIQCTNKRPKLTRKITVMVSGHWCTDSHRKLINILEVILQWYVKIKAISSVLETHSNECMATCGNIMRNSLNLLKWMVTAKCRKVTWRGKSLFEQLSMEHVKWRCVDIY